MDLGAERVAVHPDFCNVEVKSKSEESLDFIMGAIAKLKDKQVPASIVQVCVQPGSSSLERDLTAGPKPIPSLERDLTAG